MRLLTAVRIVSLRQGWSILVRARVSAHSNARDICTMHLRVMVPTAPALSWVGRGSALLKAVTSFAHYIRCHGADHRFVEPRGKDQDRLRRRRTEPGDVGWPDMCDGAGESGVKPAERSVLSI